MTSLIPWRAKRESAAPSILSNNRLDRIWEAPLLSLSGLFSSDEFAHLPRVDVTEDKKEVTVKAEIPGMSEKDVECTWHDGVLRIRGEKKSEREDKKSRPPIP